MIAFRTALYLLAGLALLTGAIDLLLGLKGQKAIGADLSPKAFDDALLNSQLRYLGAIWFGFGGLLLLCLTDLGKYSVLLQGALAVVFLGGLGRIASMIQFGLPAASRGKALVIAATAIEIIGAPGLLWWQSLLDI